MRAAQVLNAVSGSAWQDAHDLPLVSARLNASLPRSSANIAGFSVGSRLSRESFGADRVAGFSCGSLKVYGSLSVFRNATMCLISATLKILCAPHGGMIVSLFTLRGS